MTEIRTPSRSTEPSKIDVAGGRGAFTALGYRSAAVTRRDGRSYQEGSGDLHLEFDRSALINQSRAFYRDNPIYIGVIDRAVSYIVGRGFSLRVLGRKKTEENQLIERAWRNWNRLPDIRGRYTGTEGAKAVCRETMLCGDTGVIKRDGGLLQYVESEQITKGAIGSTGIDLDDDGKPTKYWVCPYGKQGRVSVANKKAIEPKDFLFISAPGRPSQTRGAPVLQSGFAMFHRINDICDSEALARQLLSRIVAAITREAGDQKAITESKLDPNKASADNSDIAQRLTELDYAIFFQARPGESVAGIERNIPGADFPATLKAFMGLVGLAFGMPRELVQLDWSDANYSVSRAIMEQAYQVFCGWQETMEAFYYQPLFEWMLPALLQAAGLEEDGGELLTDWIMPTFPWIDQLKEAQANGTKLDRCMITLADIHKALGRDSEDVITARRIEITAAIKHAQTIQKETGVEVPWQIFAGLEVPKAAAPAAANAASDEKSTDADKDKESTDE
jgi:capsid protein